MSTTLLKLLLLSRRANHHHSNSKARTTSVSICIQRFFSASSLRIPKHQQHNVVLSNNSFLLPPQLHRLLQQRYIVNRRKELLGNDNNNNNNNNNKQQHQEQPSSSGKGKNNANNNKNNQNAKGNDDNDEKEDDESFVNFDVQELMEFEREAKESRLGAAPARPQLKRLRPSLQHRSRVHFCDPDHDHAPMACRPLWMIHYGNVEYIVGTPIDTPVALYKVEQQPSLPPTAQQQQPQPQAQLPRYVQGSHLWTPLLPMLQHELDKKHGAGKFTIVQSPQTLRLKGNNAPDADREDEDNEDNPEKEDPSHPHHYHGPGSIQLLTQFWHAGHAAGYLLVRPLYPILHLAQVKVDLNDNFTLLTAEECEYLIPLLQKGNADAEWGLAESPEFLNYGGTEFLFRGAAVPTPEEEEQS